jgi:hypothetical protein
LPRDPHTHRIAQVAEGQPDKLIAECWDDKAALLIAQTPAMVRAMLRARKAIASRERDQLDAATNELAAVLKAAGMPDGLL